MVEWKEILKAPVGEAVSAPIPEGLIKEVSTTLKQYFMVLTAVGAYAGATFLASKYSVLGDLTNILVGGVMIAPLAAYGFKIRRHLANVRYRIGKLQKTGDGGEDCWSVIVLKHWIPFWRRPFDHWTKPFPFTEITVDCAGHSKGSVRCGKRPATVVALHEKFIVPIGHADKAGDTAFGRYEELEQLAEYAGLNVAYELEKGQYASLTEDKQDKITEEEYYTLIGLAILNRDGMEF